MTACYGPVSADNPLPPLSCPPGSELGTFQACTAETYLPPRKDKRPVAGLRKVLSILGPTGGGLLTTSQF